MRELKAAIRNAVLEAVEKTVRLFTKPFSEAPDLKTYSRRGFYLLGLLVALGTFVLWRQGAMSARLSESHELVRAIYKTLTDKTILTGIPDSYVPLALLPAITYVVVALWPRGRNALGETTANLAFWLLNKGISVGEWCIEHRWYSLLLIGALSAGIAVLLTLQVQQLTNERSLRNDFEYWLDSVDHFITSNPLTKPELVAYQRVQAAWRWEFRGLLANADGAAHPAICLQQMLQELHGEKNEHPWSDYLQIKMASLRKKVAQCAASATPDPADLTDVRSRALVNLLMARITVRVADDVEYQRYSTYAELKQALDLFESVAELDYGQASERYGRRYRADARNGQGTVYSNALTAYMKPAAHLTTEQLENLRSVCGSPAQCALRSLFSYQDAGRGWDDCTYQNKRERNNTTDLLIRLGQHYDTLSKSLNAPPFREWMRTRTTLASQLESHIERLMNCNSHEPFLSTFAITAAQGLAVSAQLRRQDGLNADGQLVAAGRYLRLANSFESQNVPTWDHTCFCFAVSGGNVDPTLRDAIIRGSDGLPNANAVVEMLEKRCR